MLTPKIRILDTVYPPMEDTFLLAEACVRLKGRILEVGCGSGYCSIVNALNNPENYVLGVDANPNAVECSSLNASINNVKNCSFVLSDMFDSVSGTFDAIMCNPPYLPTSESEVLSNPENLAYDGGISGRDFTDRFLNLFSDYLSPSGSVLILQSSLSDNGETEKFLNSLGFRTEIVFQESFIFEKLYVILGKRNSFQK